MICTCRTHCPSEPDLPLGEATNSTGKRGIAKYKQKELTICKIVIDKEQEITPDLVFKAYAHKSDAVNFSVV